LARIIPAAASVKNIELKINNSRDNTAQLNKDIKFSKDRMRGSNLEILNAINAEAERSEVMLKSTKTTYGEIKKGKLKYKEGTITMVFNSDYKSISSFI
jgi:hypothetical protein